MIQFDTKWYKPVSFQDILRLYCYMFQFSIHTKFLYSKGYKTGYFVIKNDIKPNIFESNWCKIKISLSKSRFCVRKEMKLILCI